MQLSTSTSPCWICWENVSCTLLFVCSHGGCKAHVSTDIHMVTCYTSAVLVTQTVFPSQRFTCIPLTSSSTPPQSSSPSQARVHTCVHGQTWGIFPRVAKTSWVFLCGGLPLSLQLCWWFSNMHARSSEIGQSQPFSFRGMERRREGKRWYPC